MFFTAIVQPYFAQLLVLLLPVSHLTITIAIPHDLTFATALARIGLATMEATNLLLVDVDELLSQVFVKVFVE